MTKCASVVPNVGALRSRYCNQKLLDDSIVTSIRRVGHVDFDKEASVLQTQRVKQNGILERNTNQAPFITICHADHVCNEEQFIGAGNNQRSQSCNRWCQKSRLGSNRKRWRWSIVHDQQGDRIVVSHPHLTLLHVTPREWLYIVDQFRECRPAKVLEV